LFTFIATVSHFPDLKDGDNTAFPVFGNNMPNENMTAVSSVPRNFFVGAERIGIWGQ
jgi:hypothetical protein